MIETGPQSRFPRLAIRAMRVQNQAMFNFFLGVAILVALHFLGAFLHQWGIPIPGGVLGLLLFYFALLSGIVKLRWVERGAGFLLRHMVLLFVPLTVGLMDMGAVLSKQALAIVASLVVSFLAVLLTTGFLAHWLLKDVAAHEGQEASK